MKLGITTLAFAAALSLLPAAPAQMSGGGQSGNKPMPSPPAKAEVSLGGKNVTITGRQTARVLQGMGGIGKTYLALKLAGELYDLFPGGVIRIDVGPQVSDEASAQIPLGRLAGYAFGGIAPFGVIVLCLNNVCGARCLSPSAGNHPKRLRRACRC